MLIVGCGEPAETAELKIEVERLELQLKKQELEEKIKPTAVPAQVVTSAPTPAPIPTPTSAPTLTPTSAPTLTPTSAPTPTITPTPVPERSFAQVVKELEKAVVLIDVVTADETACGSGVLVSSKLGKNADSLVLTNYHVVEDAVSVEIKTVDGLSASAEIIAIEQERDLALLQFDPLRVKGVRWAVDSFLAAAREVAPVWDYSSRGRTLPLGTEVAVLGYPSCGANLSLTVTKGIVSSMQSIDGQRYVQTDAAMNPGVSGGLAITEEGNVAGLAVSGIPIIAENVGFLIPANEVDVNLSAWVSQIADGRMPDLALAPTATPRPAPTATPSPTATPRPAPKSNYQIEEEWKSFIIPLTKEEIRVTENWNSAMDCRPGVSEACRVMRKPLQHELTVLWQKADPANWPHPVRNSHPRWDDMNSINVHFRKGVEAMVHSVNAYIDFHDSGRGTYADYERHVALVNESNRFFSIWDPLYHTFSWACEFCRKDINDSEGT